MNTPSPTMQLLLFGVGLLVASAAYPAQSICPAPASTVTDLGHVTSAGQFIRPGQLVPLRLNDPGHAVRYVRALLVVTASPKAAWHLTVRDQQLRALETFSSADTPGGTSRWTQRLDARSNVYFDLDSASPDVRIDIERAIVMPESAQNPYYSLQNAGVYGFGPLHEAPQGRRRLGDFVGFLQSSWENRSWCCSGVVVGEDMFLTNWHCGGDDRRMKPEGFWNQDICENTIIDISWDYDATDREFICTEVVEKNEQNDFALLRIRPLRGEDSLRRPEIRSAPIKSGELITIVHHPACRPKQLTSGCNVTDGTFRNWLGGPASDFSYPCDTEGGSSGAPVFDKDNKLVGIHHLGFEPTADGKACDKLNKGVHIQTIIENVKKPEAAARLREMVK